jgi:uncharacterized protein (TIGR03066 family)
MKRIPLAFIALAFAIFMVGCKKADDAGTPDTPAATTGKTADKAPDAAPKADDANSVVGTWTVAKADGPGDMTVEFKADNSMSGHASQKLDDKNMVAMDLVGTYKIDGDKMTFHFTKFDNINVTGPDAVAMNAKMKDKTPKAPPDETDTLAWNGKDEFSTTGPTGGKDTYKRKAG